MTVEEEVHPAPPPASGVAPSGATHGRNRLLASVGWNWAGHSVMLVAGFLLPRFIDRRLGQEILGVWDFAWSLVAYLSLVQLGIGSSVNRYVARYRAAADLTGLNRAVSTTALIQFIMGVLILALTLGTMAALPSLWGNKLGASLVDAQWLVILLGSSLAVRTALGTYSGVLTGCHRWDIYNVINSGFHVFIVAGMLISVVLGGGLRSLAAIYASEALLIGAATIVMAHRVCPGLSISPRRSTWKDAREMLRFGGKTFLSDISRTLLYQTNSLLVLSALGPAALALLSRPMALVQHVRNLSSKFSNTLTPIATEIEEADGREELVRFVSRTAQASAAFALPPTLFLCLLGGPLLRIWMGPGYQQDALIALLALGHLFSVAHQPFQTILTALNAHGRPAKAMLVTSLLASALAWLALNWWQTGLWGAALCMGAALWISDGLCLALFTARSLKLPLLHVLRDTWCRPLLCVSPFAICLVVCRLYLAPVPALFVGLFVGGIILSAVYWRWILPDSLREKIMNLLAQLTGFRRSKTLRLSSPPQT